MSRRVLYINFDFPPMSGPGIWRAFWFIKYLTRRDVKFSVICGERSHWCDRYDEALVDQIPDGVDVHRVAAMFTGELLGRIRETASNVRSRPIDRVWAGVEWRLRSCVPGEESLWMFKACAQGLELTRRTRYDCIVSSGPPHLTHAVGLFLSQVRGIPWIMDYRDLWSDDPMQFPAQQRSSRLVARLENKSIARADAVTVVTPFWRDLLRSVHGEDQNPGKFHLLRNGHQLEPEDVDGQRVRPFGGGTWIHYNGTPQYLAESPNLLRAVRMATESGRGQTPGLHLSFTGMSPGQTAAVSELGLGGIVHDVGAMSLDRSLEYCRGADVLLIVVNDDVGIRRGVIPAKTYEAMALGKPILAVVPRESDVKELLEEYDSATICAVDDPEDIARAIRELIDRHVDPGGQDLEKAHEFRARYSREERARELLDIMDSLRARR